MSASVATGAPATAPAVKDDFTERADQVLRNLPLVRDALGKLGRGKTVDYVELGKRLVREHGGGHLGFRGLLSEVLGTSSTPTSRAAVAADLAKACIERERVKARQRRG